MSHEDSSTPCGAFVRALVAAATPFTGHGSVFYPTMPNGPVYFNARRSFAEPQGKLKTPFVAGSLESRHAERGVGMHFESSMIKCVDDNILEVAFAHNTSNVEMARGPVVAVKVAGGAKAEELRATVESFAVAGSEESRTVRTRREWRLTELGGGGGSNGGRRRQELNELFSLASVNVQELTPHLQIKYERDL